ncbi:glycerophosphodiester phosphodiesterase [Glutamicibacter sp. JC586]|uniref:glycerophosphodiester phosphodiesterase n=1 Tax=Glutamicibacter sp. JC586 TaxID=2590552 RepID=UPI00135CF130|nr:glycerophosphodiester phosphodiesterase [Glutamicibacter sp. JC586]
MKTVDPHAARLSRRTFLAMAGASLIMVNCSDQMQLEELRPMPMSAGELLASDHFYIAHRGSGDNWTEHTLHAYRQAIAHGARAIEIYVHRTRDGYFVCHHDSNLQRPCGVSQEISDISWEQLQKVRNDARAWLGPSTPLELIPSLTEALSVVGGKAVLFIEDKSGKHATDLIELLEGSSAPDDPIVWKQPAMASTHTVASQAGFKTWGYFAPEVFADIEPLATAFDAIGIYDSADPKTISRAVSTGLPVICWKVHTRSQRDTLLEQGVQVMMCSNYPYVTSAIDSLDMVTDEFESGCRTDGDLPDVLTWRSQPEFIPAEGILRLSDQHKASYVVGSMARAMAGDGE